MDINAKGTVAKNIWAVLWAMIQTNGTYGNSRGDMTWGALSNWHGCLTFRCWKLTIQFNNPFKE